MMSMTEFIMKFAPIGVFGLVAGVISETGYKAAGPLATFALVVLLALAVHAFVTLPLFLRFVGGVKPYGTLKACAMPAAFKPCVKPPMSRTFGCKKSTASCSRYSRR